MRGRLGSGRTGEHWATLFVPRPATPAPTGFRPQCAQEARIAVDLRSSESLPDLSLLTAAGAVVGTGGKQCLLQAPLACVLWVAALEAVEDVL